LCSVSPSSAFFFVNVRLLLVAENGLLNSAALDFVSASDQGGFQSVLVNNNRDVPGISASGLTFDPVVFFFFFKGML
jgi:hypothetical protein